MTRLGGLLSILIFVLLSSCGLLNRQTVVTPTLKNEVVIGQDTPVWVPKKYSYKPSPTRHFDLIHTKVRVKFDWQKTQMAGQAELTLKPFAYPQDSLLLDAKGFTLNRVLVNGQPVQYRYDNRKIQISLGKSYPPGFEFVVLVDYIAKPNQLQAGGSAAITSDKGLYFINPDGKNPYKPRQLWTQGETEATSCWCPTIEATNERCTQEIIMTVEDQFKTLSNGLLISSTKNPDGTRTDHWKQALPHAPYLFMMAVGDFAVVKDTWRGKEVSYYVEPEYAPYAKLIFGNTPEMLEFFSKKLGYDYPWEKYSQIVVRDFVSGAMENTSATIHMEKLQHDSRAHLDDPLEDYISHELFHHWFGDLVTCESWANLPLNESFATYGEYLWREYKYGAYDADHHLDADLTTYLFESGTKREPLIRYHHDKPEDMFDAHSYQKGCRVLHVLRKELGDDIFFAGIKKYLTNNAFQAVEISDLRKALEEVSGRDLNWFFDQWFMQAGHPELNIQYSYLPETKQLTMFVQQYQDKRFCPVYRLPFVMEIVTPTGKKRTKHWFTTVDSLYKFTLDDAPIYADFDAEKTLLARITEKKPLQWWFAQYKNGDNFKQQEVALNKISLFSEKDSAQTVLIDAMNDKYWYFRQQAMNALNGSSIARSPNVINTVINLAVKDPKASVRETAITFLSSNMPKTADTTRIYAVIEQAINDSSYAVCSSALEAYSRIRSGEKTLAKARHLMNLNSEKVRTTVAEIFMNEKQPDALPYTITTLDKMGGSTEAMFLIQRLGFFLVDAPENDKSAGISFLKTTASDNPAWYLRLQAARALLNFKDKTEIKQFLMNLKAQEKHPQLQKLYAQLLQL